MLSCARATRGLRRPSLDTRSGRPSSPPSRERLEDQWSFDARIRGSTGLPCIERPERAWNGHMIGLVDMKRKPGEPIYLKHHMLGLTLAVVSPILLPFLYHRYISPLSFDVLFFAGMIIALIGSIALYFAYRSSAQNEP